APAQRPPGSPRSSACLLLAVRVLVEAIGAKVRACAVVSRLHAVTPRTRGDVRPDRNQHGTGDRCQVRVRVDRTIAVTALVVEDGLLQRVLHLDDLRVGGGPAHEFSFGVSASVIAARVGHGQTSPHASQYSVHSGHPTSKFVCWGLPHETSALWTSSAAVSAATRRSVVSSNSTSRSPSSESVPDDLARCCTAAR